MIELFYGCYCSDLSVFPGNWQDTGKNAPSLEIEWYISYRFYDPKITDPKTGKIKPKLVQVKGMNKFHTLKERRKSTQLILDEELSALKEGFNAISGLYMIEREKEIVSHEIDPHMPFNEALPAALKLMTCGKSIKGNISSMIKFVNQAAEQLRIEDKPICEIKRRNIKSILSVCKLIKGDSWSAIRHNMYRAYLKMIFDELFEVEAIEYNPVEKIKKEKEIKKIAVLLTEDQRKTINEYLFENCYEFWRLMHIFYHSGARETELMELKVKNVNLKEQKYKSIVYKGRQFREVERTIKDMILPLWNELLKEADPEDYVFSKGLVPGPVRIHPKQISKRWKRWVKNDERLNIQVDFYKLKHLNTTTTVDFLSKLEQKQKEAEQLAAKQNGHTSTAMVVKIYDLDNEKRKHEILKKVHNEL